MSDRLEIDRECHVQHRTLYAGRRRIRLERLEQTRLSRPGIGVALALGALSGAVAAVFHDILYTHEIALMLGLPLALLPLIAQIGLLRLEHHGIGGTSTLIGPHRRLRRIRDAIDAALDAAEKQP